METNPQFEKMNGRDVLTLAEQADGQIWFAGRARAGMKMWKVAKLCTVKSKPHGVVELTGPYGLPVDCFRTGSPVYARAYHENEAAAKAEEEQQA